MYRTPPLSGSTATSRACSSTPASSAEGGSYRPLTGRAVGCIGTGADVTAWTVTGITTAHTNVGVLAAGKSSRPVWTHRNVPTTPPTHPQTPMP